MAGRQDVGARERFQCPRCGYQRPLRREEDGFTLYLFHLTHCGERATDPQLWLPFLAADLHGSEAHARAVPSGPAPQTLPPEPPRPEGARR